MTNPQGIPIQTIAGIDPGKKGGVAVIRHVPGGVDTGVDIYAWPLPWIDDDLDLDVLAERLCGVNLVILEKISAFPKMNRAACFTFGDGYGQLRAVLKCWHIPYVLVAPKVWQKEVLGGLTAGEKKSVLYCQRKYPALGIKKTHDGMADAICLAEYGRRLK